jgi:hypothetical protein
MNGGTVKFSGKIAILTLIFTAEHMATTERDRRGIRKFSTPALKQTKQT